MTPATRQPGVARWWEEHLVPRLVDLALTDATVGRWRTTVCADLRGDVLEIGFGSGRNLSFYPDAVRRVLAVEPSGLAWQRAGERIASFSGTVDRVGVDAGRLPVGNSSVDAAVSTWTMCTVPDIGSALDEVRRVLRPGGTLRFVEHTLAPSPRVAWVQRAMQPVWGRLSGGCHVDRDIVGLLEDRGYAVDLTYAGHVAGGPAAPWSRFVTGSATPA